MPKLITPTLTLAPLALVIFLVLFLLHVLRSRSRSRPVMLSPSPFPESFQALRYTVFPTTASAPSQPPFLAPPQQSSRDAAAPKRSPLDPPSSTIHNTDGGVLSALVLSMTLAGHVSSSTDEGSDRTLVPSPNRALLHDEQHPIFHETEWYHSGDGGVLNSSQLYTLSKATERVPWLAAISNHLQYPAEAIAHRPEMSGFRIRLFGECGSIGFVELRTSLSYSSLVGSRLLHFAFMNGCPVSNDFSAEATIANLANFSRWIW